MLHLECLESRLSPSHLLGLGFGRYAYTQTADEYGAYFQGRGVVEVLPDSGIGFGVPVAVQVSGVVLSANYQVNHAEGRIELNDHRGDRAILQVWGDAQPPGSVIPEQLHYHTSASTSGNTGVFAGQDIHGTLDLVFTGVAQGTFVIAFH